MKFAEIKKKIKEARDLPWLQNEVELQLKEKLRNPNVKQEMETCKTEEERQKVIENVKDEIMSKLVYKKVTSDIQREIGGRLLSIRNKQKMEQLDVRDDYLDESGFEISNSCLSRWESGQRSVDIIFLLWFVEKYGGSLVQVLTGEEPEPKDKIAQDAVQDLERVSADIAELIRKLKS